jgi:hypothetical protein
LSLLGPLVLLGLAGAPLAYRLAGLRAEAVPLAPLLGAGYLAAGATWEVALGGPPLGDAIVALALGALLPMIGPICRAAHARRVFRPAFQMQEFMLLLAPVLVLGWTLTTLKRVDIAWDGRSIWFFHARMLLGGRDTFLAQAHAFQFSHPDYPPLIPAVVSLGWGLGKAIDYRQGQLSVAALTACATVLTGIAMARALAASRWLAPVVAAVCVGLCYGVWDAYATNGYVDPLTAALFLAAAVYGLLAPPGGQQVRLAIALAVLASAVKNEGLVFSLIVLVLVAVRQVLMWWRGTTTSALVRPRWFVVAFGLMLLWPLAVRSQALGSDLTAASLLHGEAADPVHRLGMTLYALSRRVGPAIAGLIGLGVVGFLGTREAGRRVGSFLLAELGATVALLTVYATGPDEIRWWLDTSVDRTDMALRAGGLLGAVYAAFTAGALLVEEARIRRRRPN